VPGELIHIKLHEASAGGLIFDCDRDFCITDT